MKRLHKLTQQRRRQLHVHMPPSGLTLTAYEARPAQPLLLPPRPVDKAAQCPANDPVSLARQQVHSLL